MQILHKNKLVKYENNLCIKKNKISFGNDPIELKPNAEYIVPGFIDQHVHGLNGIDFHLNSDGNLKKAAQNLLNEGVTSFFATTSTDTIEKLEISIKRLSKVYFENINLLGIHLEGPFISKDFCGAQNKKHIIPGNKKLFDFLNYNNSIKIVSLAIEENLELAKYLQKKEIKVLNAHSNANASQLVNIDGITHFGNAHRPLKSREIGITGSGLLREDLYLELICDFEHLSPDFIKLVLKTRDISKLILITDSILLKGLPNSIYEIADYKIIKTDKTVKLESGNLVGSILSMNKAVKNMSTLTSLENSFLMASKNVCEFNNIKNKGIIENGYDFDITILDKDLNVIQIFVNGIEQKICTY
ncbi:MAG: N-acetylglucosamine-6-phosphate deacetylase [Mycoplasmatales bacterium]